MAVLNYSNKKIDCLFNKSYLIKDLYLQCKLFDNGQSIGSNSVEFICDGSKKPFRIMFKRPVEIKAEFPYIVSAKINVSTKIYYP